MSKQPKALELAQALDVQVEIGGGDLDELAVAAECLRSQHQLVGELRASLDRIVSYYKNPHQTITLWDQAKSDHEHTMFGEAIAILARLPT